ncbi:MAG: MFS transporter [Peptococcaceae bacterium]|nr:MFS transporter [Peptococcaceae bacterium]
MTKPWRAKKGESESKLINIFFLGLVSFFTDVSAEMVYPLIPLYLISAFGATPALVGTVEGIAESLASLLKVYSGYISDKFQKKKALAFAGYSAGLFYKLVLLMAGSWVGVLLARVVDRFGKGIRVAPRDALVSESADKSALGKAYGLHKALDMAGAALGILITYFLLRGGASDYKKMFLISIIPAVLGLCMFFFIKEKKAERRQVARPRFWRGLRELDGRLKLYLLVVFLFTLGNSSNAFLLLKAKSIGFDDVSAVLLYFAYNITASVLSLPLGRLSDKVGRKALLVSGYLVFSFVYFGFAVAGNQPLLAMMFVLYGVYTAMITGVERAFVAELAPAEIKGAMLGLQSTVAGIALLPASVITGLLWIAYGSVVPFLFGASLSLAAAMILLIFMRNPVLAHS